LVIESPNKALKFVMNTNRKCSTCNTPNPDKGRAFDGRRVYRCKSCFSVWSEGLQNRTQRYSQQRFGNQFADSKGTGHIS